MPNYKRSKSQKKNGGSRNRSRSTRSAKRGGRRATKSSRGGQRAKIGGAGGAGGTIPDGIRQFLPDFKQSDFDSKMYKYFGSEIEKDMNFSAHMTKNNLRDLVNAKSTDLESDIQLDFKPYIQ